MGFARYVSSVVREQASETGLCRLLAQGFITSFVRHERIGEGGRLLCMEILERLTPVHLGVCIII